MKALKADSSDQVKRLILPARLQALANLVPLEARRIIDVGADHGLLLAWLLLHRQAVMGVATDIHEAPAQRSRRTLDSFGLKGRYQVFCCDGLEKVTLEQGDSVIIAGMGGLEISKILSAALAKTERAILAQTSFLVQPQKSWAELGRFLALQGFEITQEQISYDRDKFYRLWTLRFSEKILAEPTAFSLYVGTGWQELALPQRWDYLLRRKETLTWQSKGNPELFPVLEELEDSIRLVGEEMHNE